MKTFFAIALVAGVCMAAIQAVPAVAEQHCRMEKQCRWVNFKKVCTYVKAAGKGRRSVTWLASGRGVYLDWTGLC